MTMRLSRRTFSMGATSGALALAIPSQGIAQQTYPAGQTVRFIVPFPAGGATDLGGRLIADRLSQIWKSPTIVENVPGAGTNIGNDRVAKGPTDGSMVLIMAPPMVVNQFLFSKLSYSPEADIIPVSNVARVPNLLCVRKDLPVGSVADLIAYGKANPNKLNCATAGIGTSVHLSSELFKQMTGLQYANVHYRGSAPAINDLVSGSVDFIFDNIGAIINLARAGAVKPIAITSLERSKLAAEYPTVAETLPGFETASFTGVGVKSGTPREICEVIEKGCLALAKDPTVVERFASLGVETVPMGMSEYQDWIAAERAKWGKIITAMNIKVD